MAQPAYPQLVEQNRRLTRGNRQLRREAAQKDRRITELEARVAELEPQVQRLTQLLEQATRKSRRQAAPFSKGAPKPEPKQPGRKLGTLLECFFNPQAATLADEAVGVF